MAEKDEHMIRACLSAVRARVGQAEARHADAIRIEADSGAAADRADKAVKTAADDWQRQMRETFDPILGALLGREVLTRAGMAKEAHVGRIEAEEARAAAALDWRQQDARRCALEEEAATALRQRNHRMHERLLASLADRETRKWMGR